MGRPTFQPRKAWRCIIDPSGEFRDRHLSMLEIQMTADRGYFPPGTAWVKGKAYIVIEEAGDHQVLRHLR